MTAIALPGGIVLRPQVKPRQIVTFAVVILAAVLIFTELLPHLVHPPTTHSRNWENPFPVIVLGTIEGATYGLLGVGLVLIYRSNRIINFAHGQIGAFGAAVFGLLVVKGHVPYWLAMLPALAATAGVGAISEAVVIRRLRKAPPLMSIVATLGIGQFLVLFAAVFNSQAGAGALFPQPPYLPSFRVGALLVTPSYFAMLVLSPIVVFAIAAFLKFSRFGLALRGAAANPEAARMAGIFAGRMSSLAWALAGGVAALSAILTAPTQGFTNADSFGPSLLLRALVAGVVARMVSLPIAMLAGVGLGVIEQLLLHNYPQSGLVEVVLFFIILGALLVQKGQVGRAEEKGSWAAVQGARPLPAVLREIWLVRNLGLLFGLVVLGIFALLPTLGVNNSHSVKLTGIFGFLIVGLSIGVVTGLGGQLSLGQFGIAAVGAIASYQVAKRTGNYFEAFFYAGLASAALSVLIGIPALRVKGLLLTVTTLSFGLVVPAYLLQQPWAFGSGADPGRPTFGHFAFETGKEYYYVGLFTLVVALVLARNIRSGGIGRLLISVRDNEDAARAFTVPAAKVKLQGFALSGFIAGIGGAMYGHSLSLESTSSFPTEISITIVVMCVIGGIGLLSGPLIGSVIVLFIPMFLPLHSFALAATALGQLLIIMYLPGGLGVLATPFRDKIAKAIGRRYGVDVDQAFLAEMSSGAASTTPPPAVEADLLEDTLQHAGGLSEEPVLVPVQRPPTTTQPVAAPPRSTRGNSDFILEATGLRKSFGGVRAVRGVSFNVRQGETLGLIGPNGAGKTTTFELLAGFTRADEGTVKFAGQDVTFLGPEARGRLGMIRSFQDAALFPTLTVSECVQLSLERVDPTRFLPAIAGITRQEKRKVNAANDLVAWMGLERYRSSQIQELSTGTRRIAEIACLVALEPRLLLLDEPSSGVAQKETEALGLLLERLREQLNLTLIIIEHDIPLIMGMSDRIVAMADGEVIVTGSPAVVRANERVIEAYLGGNIDAIERSGGAGGVVANNASDRIEANAAVAAERGADGIIVRKPLVAEVTPSIPEDAVVDLSLSGPIHFDEPLHAMAGGFHDDDADVVVLAKPQAVASNGHASNGHASNGHSSNGHSHGHDVSIPGISKSRAATLIATFGTVENIRSASVDELQQVPGIGQETARRVLLAVGGDPS